ncbi:DMT family transporter [Snodgrassella sp. CFCC 13594]|uniref:DMT family transporter n=1 Tax=Snodgrassella sp. CFCC 13594 TaxID=1775559 RepID=UPI00082C1103|nr:DMT family transporter [Snodgrassella sp. CFCC 13594]
MNKTSKGWLNGLMGVVIFSGSLPATKAAVMGFDPFFLTGARASIAALISLVFLLWLQQPRPTRQDMSALSMVALGCVIGFPLFTALALQHISSTHSIVFVGLLPLCTALFAVLRSGEQPQPLFWLFALIGSGFVAAYALLQDGTASLKGDILMLLAVAVCGLGYAEGAQLSRRLGGWQVISWALVLALPVMLPLCFWYLPNSLAQINASAWLGFVYVTLFSMLIGFVFWYRGLALGGIAAVGQLQLLQPFMGLALAALLLHESVNNGMLVATAGAMVCVAGAKKYAV